MNFACKQVMWVDKGQFEMRTIYNMPYDVHLPICGICRLRIASHLLPCEMCQIGGKL